jgi:hypothetical protein
MQRAIDVHPMLPRYCTLLEPACHYAFVLLFFF